LTTRLSFAVALMALLFAGLAAFAAPTGKDPHGVDLGQRASVIELMGTLGPYQMPAKIQPSDATWYTINATNASVRPAIRVLLAGQPASAALGLVPRATRPQIVSVAGADPAIVVEQARAYGGHAWRVTIPPATNAALAIEVANGGMPPSVLAWTEPALAAHNRQIGIFIAAVAGLIFAAAAIAAGLAVMTAHRPPMWASLTLLFVLLARLATTGMFDRSLATHVGGPYGLTAMFAGLALACGIKLADVIVPVREIWPWAARWLRIALAAVVAIALGAYLGVPGAAVLADTLVVIGSAGITAYLVHRGSSGAQAARVVSPSAAVFALVALAASVTTLGGMGSSAVAPDVAGGFAAAGAVLLALAVAAGEGIAVLPLPRFATPSAANVMQAIGASHQGVFDLDLKRDEVHISREAGRLIGLGETRMAHAAWMARVHADDRAVYAQAIGAYRAQPGLAFRIEFRLRAEDGRYPWFELRATTMGAGKEAERCLGLIADISARKDGEAPAAEHPHRDALTGLGNRLALAESLEALGDGFLDTVVALLDIDRFKQIHASLGDAGGDALLVAIAERLAKRFPDAGLFRAGGDAFALVMRHPSESAQALGGEIVEACAGGYTQDGRSIFAPTSVGVTVGHDARDAADLIKNAELALGQAKRDGGGCARVYARSMSAAEPGDPVALEAELRAAIESDQLEMFYQPIVRLADGTIAGFEALLRWRHPEKGLIAPADFIAHSEATGSIVTLGRFALEQAAHDLSQWQRFFPLTPPLFMSVNLSPRQLRDAEFETFLRRLLDECGIQAGTLKLELTESMTAMANAPAVLRRIRALGAGLAIDDFGTGQSSLSRLKDLPFDTVKIDQSFLARHGGTHSETDSGVVLSSIVSLAHDLRRAVVVEGVESEDDLRQLQALGCEYGQGFYFSPPLPTAEALNYIARHYSTGA
jgi:diguanylate cyclase (GGDEF)-like protein/PAS domain S-box-containing protein